MDLPGAVDADALAARLDTLLRELGAPQEAALPLLDQLQSLTAERNGLRRLIESPELHDFAHGVVLEAAHQRRRWGAKHDAQKEPEDWFWTLGFLAGKAQRAALDGNPDKALHHTIASAALLANWHAAILVTLARREA